MTTKKTEDMTVTDTMDEIFGEGTSEQLWSGEDLAIARQPYCYVPPDPYARPVKLKITPSGHISPTHPQAELGRYGEVYTVMICRIPPGTPISEVVIRYSVTVDLRTRDVPLYHHDELGTGRILR